MASIKIRVHWHWPGTGWSILTVSSLAPVLELILRLTAVSGCPAQIIFICRRIDDGERLCKDLITLVQERANIEKEFAKQLKQWSGKWNNLIEKGNSRVVGYSKYLL